MGKLCSIHLVKILASISGVNLTHLDHLHLLRTRRPCPSSKASGINSIDAPGIVLGLNPWVAG